MTDGIQSKISVCMFVSSQETSAIKSCAQWSGALDLISCGRRLQTRSDRGDYKFQTPFDKEGYTKEWSKGGYRY